MKNFVMILSQLFYGVTVGAIGAALSSLATSAAAAVGLGGAGWFGLKWFKGRKRKDD